MTDFEIVQSGKYYFKITRNIRTYEGVTIIHTYKIGGDYQDCVNISYIYENNIPVRVKIPHLLYEPECSMGTTLERGGGTEVMIKTALRYAYKEVPTLPLFEFEDNSHIDCIEKNPIQSPPRKPTKPIHLAYFYIAYHSMTWYEARFLARMSHTPNYTKYREKLKFLTNPAEKVPFHDFLSIIGSSLESLASVSYLETLYSNANTYRAFFEKIPKYKRCDILFPWLYTFMETYLGSVFSDKGWVIDVRNMDTNTALVGGSLRKGSLYRIFSYRKAHNL